jgi:hypothetical protein
MASNATIDFGDSDEPTSLRSVGRSALWAGFAMVAMIAAILTARSETGARRINEALNVISEPAEAAHAPVPQIAYDPVAEAQTRRLAERVRTLSADRERLLARLDALERAVDVTGSIAHRPPAAPATPPPVQAPAAAPVPEQAIAVAAHDRALPAPAASVTIIPPPRLQAESLAGQPEPAEPQEAQAVASAVEPEPSAPPAIAAANAFGIDLGTAPDIAQLRARWSTVLAQHGQLLDGLRPTVIAQKRQQHHASGYRLVAGPLRDPQAAERVCAVLAGLGQACRPSNFDPDQKALP